MDVGEADVGKVLGRINDARFRQASAGAAPLPSRVNNKVVYLAPLK